jgi:hypothetical protein
VYCTNCGNQLPPDALACGHCGHAVPHFPAPPNVPNYLVHAIAVTLCCCIPFGIVALVFSAQVNNKLAAGDFAGAQESSRKAKMWFLWALITGLVLNLGGAAWLIMLARS